MAPIDYSKWDNIDTDSESEVPPVKAPAGTANVPSPSDAQQPPTTISGAADNGTGSVQAVIVRCDFEKLKDAPWSATMIPENHPVFSEAVPPIPALVEVPLVIHRVGTQSRNRDDLDNQIATYLNIDLESGFAPSQWQSHIGTVIVARKDKKPLLPHHLEAVWMYCDHILDLFGDGVGAPRSLYRRKAFEDWWKGYCEEQRGFRFGDGGQNDPDDWREVKSPYDI